MTKIPLNKATDLLELLDLSKFPLVQHYIDYDSCYLSDDWIKYYVYYDSKNFEPIGVIAERLPEEEIGHILILEVNKTEIHKGYGSKILKDFMKKKEYWELWSVETAEDFYRKMGYVQNKDNELFYYGLELI